MPDARPTGEIQLKNVTVEALLLPKGSRTVTIRTLTLASAASEGASSLSLQADVATTIRPGTGLSFLDGTQRKTALVIDTVAVGTTPTSVEVASLINNISAAATAQLIDGLTPVLGIQEFNYQTQPQEVDTTNMQSGIGMESALVRRDATYDVSGIKVIRDRGLYNIIKPVAEDPALFGREVYLVATTPEGEIRRGACKIKNYSEPGNQNEVGKYSFQAQFQGDSFQRITPYVIA